MLEKTSWTNGAENSSFSRFTQHFRVFLVIGFQSSIRRDLFRKRPHHDFITFILEKTPWTNGAENSSFSSFTQHFRVVLIVGFQSSSNILGICFGKGLMMGLRIPCSPFSLKDLKYLQFWVSILKQYCSKFK